MRVYPVLQGNNMQITGTDSTWIFWTCISMAFHGGCCVTLDLSSFIAQLALDRYPSAYS